MKELDRSLGLISVVAISVSAMLGSGIFVLPGIASAQTGPSVWLAYLLAALCVLPAALSKSELATAMPSSGGSYVYLDRSFGPLFGTISGLGLWLSLLLKASFALVGFGTYLYVFAPSLPLKPVALALLVAIVLLNLVGVRRVGQAQVAIVTLAVTGLLALLAMALPRIEEPLLLPHFTDGAEGLISAAGFVFVSYAGVTKVAAIAEEVDDPGRNLPLGILISLAVVSVLYALVTLGLVGNVPHERLVEDLRPMHTLATHLGGPWAGVLAAILGVATMTSMANAGLLASSRFPFAMSRERLLPPLLKGVHSRFKTPLFAILLTGGVMALCILFLDVKGMAKLASAFMILIYIAVHFAVIVFRESRAQWYRPQYRSPAYPWMQIFGILSGLALLFMLGSVVPIALLVVLVPGGLLYLVYGRRRTKRLGVLSKIGRRDELLSGERSEPQITVAGSLGEAVVVIALCGKERCPEMLVDVGVVLAQGRRLLVLHLSEFPEQIALETELEEEASVRSLRRRIEAMAEEKALDLEVQAVATRDLVHTVHDVTQKTHCDWLLMEWQGRTHQSRLAYSPLGWLINHLCSNLALYKDEGIRYVRKILVYAEPGPHDALVVDTADQLAQLWGAELTLIRVVSPQLEAPMKREQRAYLRQLATLCFARTHHRLIESKDAAAAVGEESADHDLLVMGAPCVGFWGMIRGTPADRIIESAACSVLRVRAPRIQTHRAFSRRAALPSPPRSDSVLVRAAEGVVEARLEVESKEALFDHIGEVFAELLPDLSAKEITSALWRREESQNTSVGRGVALPHASIPSMERAILGVFTTAQKIDYRDPVEEGVDVIFVVLSPPRERRVHLKLLSEIALLSVRTAILRRMRRAHSPEELLRVLHRCYRNLYGYRTLPEGIEHIE